MRQGRCGFMRPPVVAALALVAGFSISPAMAQEHVHPQPARKPSSPLTPTAKKLNDRKLQRALLQFFKPENYFEVREALLKAGRADLIGSGCDEMKYGTVYCFFPARRLASRND